MVAFNRITFDPAILRGRACIRGMRRRHGLSELQIHADEPPRYAELRRLPKVDLNAVIAEEG